MEGTGTVAVRRACFREYKKEAYDPFVESGDIAGAATALLLGAAERLSAVVAYWIRVGFSQGNFNADNCLVGGRTMDYGPFGWMEEYNPLFAKWTGSGPHFGFLNQPTAGYVNYNVLVDSVVPVICAACNIQDPTDTMEYFQTRAQEAFQRNFDRALANKMGVSTQNNAEAAAAAVKDLWRTLEPLLRVSRVDWTLFWRQLTHVAKEFPNFESCNFEEMLTTLIGDDDDNGRSPFYELLSHDHRKEYLKWIQQWRNALKDQDGGVYERMRLANPKYVLREWMLVDAYGEVVDDILKSMFELIQTPYDEGTSEQESLYYRRAHEDDLTLGGTAFMSCSL